MMGKKRFSDLFFFKSFQNDNNSQMKLIINENNSWDWLNVNEFARNVNDPSSFYS